jgi:phosphodiesterase/alkaline phosphatase D-like protein
MDDFKLNIEVKVTVKPVNPKLGTTQRGPYERNLFVVSESKNSHYVGAKTDVATLVANAIKVISREWDLASGEPPIVNTKTVDNILDTSANVNAGVDDQGVSTVVTCEYGITKDLGSSTAATESPLTGDAMTDVNIPLTGLTASSQYYYRIKAVSTAGTIYSELKTFITNITGYTTTAAPTTTAAATTTTI